MYERMLDKNTKPTVQEIREHIGKRSWEYIEKIKKNLQHVFEITVELKFPFGNNYGWGYKFNNKTKHLFYVLFEKNAITVMMQNKKIDSDFGRQKYEELSSTGKEYWEKRYPCGDGGGWIHYRILTAENFADIGIFIMLKMKKEIEWEV